MKEELRREFQIAVLTLKEDAFDSDDRFDELEDTVNSGSYWSIHKLVVDNKLFRAVFSKK